jgi:ferredoxin
MNHNIEFTNGDKITVEENINLSESMDVTNSPILFGCRTGICATCIVKVIEGFDNLSPASDDEKEVLDIFDKGENTRLACKLQLTGDIKLEYIGK